MVADAEAAASLLSLEENLCEIRDFMVDGFRKEDLGRDSDRGGDSLLYRHVCNDALANEIFTNTAQHPFITVWTRGPFAIALLNRPNDDVGRVEREWLPFADGIGQIRVRIGQKYAVFSHSGGGNINGGSNGTVCILEASVPVLRKVTPYGPFPLSHVNLGLSVNSSPLTIIPDLVGFDVALCHIHLRRVGTGSRPYNLQDNDSEVLYQVQLTQDEAHTVTFPRGCEVMSTSVGGGSVRIRDNNGVASAVDVLLLAKYIPIMR